MLGYVGVILEVCAILTKRGYDCHKTVEYNGIVTEKQLYCLDIV